MQVACRELGYTDGYYFQGNRIYNPASGPFWMGNVNCLGHEMSIWNCPHISFPDLDCFEEDHAELFCSNTGLFHVYFPALALRMSADTHRHSEFQGERGHFKEFTVLEIVEKGVYFVINLGEIIK